MFTHLVLNSKFFKDLDTLVLDSDGGVGLIKGSKSQPEVDFLPGHWVISMTSDSQKA